MDECRAGDPVACTKLHSLELAPSLCVSIVWPSSQEDAGRIRTLMEAVALNISLDELFQSGVSSSTVSSLSLYCLRGFVCFYGMHYVSIFQVGSSDKVSSGSHSRYRVH